MRKLIAFACAVCVLAGVAIAQVPGLFITNLTGLEQINVLNAGPQIATITVATLRNTTGYSLSSTATGATSPVPTVLTNNLIYTAALTGPVTVTLPPSPPDGMLFAVHNGTGSSFTQTITLSTTDGSTIVAGSTAVNLTAGSGQEWQYTATARIWYRIG